jgi:hypothetical protein
MFTRLIAGSSMNISASTASAPMNSAVRGASFVVPTASAAMSSSRVRGEPDIFW